MISNTPIIDDTSRDAHRATLPKRQMSRRHDLIRVLLRRLRLTIDIVGLAAGFGLGYWFTGLSRQTTLQSPLPPMGDFWPIFAIQTVTMLSTFFFARLYHPHRTTSRIDVAYQIVTALSVGIVITSGLITFLPRDNVPDYPRQMIVFVWLSSMVLVVLGRELHRAIEFRIRVMDEARDRVLVIGSGDPAKSIIHQIQMNPSLGYTIVGVVNGREPKSVAGIPVIGHPEDLPYLIDSFSIDEVIIALPERSNADLAQLVSLCQRGRTTIKIYPDMLSYISGDMSVDDLNGMPMLNVRDIALRGWKLSLKRAVDIMGALFGLISLSPLLLLTTLLIRLESPGPIFFCQERCGLDGRPFPMIKFRSMRRDAESKGPGWTTKGDMRVTRLGKWMRKTNWDEIPNLINVLLGHMSLVGPRPEQAYFVQKFRADIPRYMERHREKAGMTGWAQVNGLRGDTSIEERTKYDLWYVENWSLWLDIKIILRTVLQTLLARSPNAY
jgi:exopolysaccharide biosynthesis polyprenyl glycosylphosphotransferase